jgi:ABC-2 type transport system permease protein
MIAAILRAQWLSMRFGGRGSVVGLITGLLWYGVWFCAACAVCYWTWHASAAALAFNLPVGLLLVCFYWQLVPIISASMGASLDMRKLLAYPVPHRKLFLVEVLLRLTTGIEMLMVLTGGAAGLIANPRHGWAAAPRIAAALAIFALGNVLFASGMRSILERLLARRRVRELMAVVMVCVWMLPRMLMSTGFQLRSLGPAARVIQAFGFPWTAAARSALNDSAAAALLALCGWTLLAAWFGRAQFERGLRFDAVAAQATRLGTKAAAREPVSERFFRLPAVVWRDPLAAIVEKELRTLARTPRFRMVFIMGFTFGLMLWLPMVIGRHGTRHSTLSHYFLTVVCAYSLTLLGQVSYWNCFGFDRSATSLYFAVPQPMTAIVVGKNIASLVFIYLEVMILTGITLALRMLTGWEQWVEALVVIAICSLYLLAIGNISSVHYPRALHPERVSQGGATSRFQGMLFLLYPVALLPVLLAYLARYAFDSALVFWIVLALAGAIGGTVYWLALESAVKTARERREQILQELSQGEGPVVSG